MPIPASEQSINVGGTEHRLPPGFHSDMFQVIEGTGPEKPVILADWEWTDPLRNMTPPQIHFLAGLITDGFRGPGVLGSEYNPLEIDQNAQNFIPLALRRLPGGQFPEKFIRDVKDQELLPGGAMHRRVDLQHRLKSVFHTAEQHNPGNYRFYPDPANSLNYEMNKFVIPILKLCLSAMGMTAGPFLNNMPLFLGGLVSSGILVGTIGANWMAEANGYGIYGSTKRPDMEGNSTHTFWQKVTEAIPSTEMFRDQRNAFALHALSQVDLSGNIVYVTSSAHNTQIGETLRQLNKGQDLEALRKLLWHATSIILPVQGPRLYDNKGNNIWKQEAASHYINHPLQTYLNTLASDLLRRVHLRS